MIDSWAGVWAGIRGVAAIFLYVNSLDSFFNFSLHFLLLKLLLLLYFVLSSRHIHQAAFFH